MKSIVLINCDTSLEYEVKEAIINMNIHIFPCIGAYNFIAEVEEDTPEALRRSILYRIRPIKGIRSTLTLMVKTSWSKTDE